MSVSLHDKGRSGLAGMQRGQGTNTGVGAWTVAMETEAKLTSCKRGRFQALQGVKELVLDTLHSPAYGVWKGGKHSADMNED